MSRKINIRPTTSVYATYKNINYQIWTAIAEFVDNSTQSYYDNKEKLIESKYWKGCCIEINYDKDENGEFYLEIKDNAFGMDFHDFQRAIVLDSKPAKATRSEFGMGLKTAACWFGLKWSVESTALGSKVKYKTNVDVEHLSKYKNEEIEVEEIECSPKEHGTIIKIWDLNRKIQGRSVGKTKDMLRGMYRVDLRSGEIDIYYNEEKLIFEDPEVYEETLPDGNLLKWEMDNVNFVIGHNDRNYHVTGKIAIRRKASTGEAGLTLIRRGRVIIGGYENNYRPEEIFGKSNSFEYQRLFGELHLDDWPVVQTKDNFDWNNGLEDKFIDVLKEITKDYVRKAKTIRVRKTVNATENIEKMISSFEKAGVIENPKIEDITEKQIIDNTENNDFDEEDKSYFGTEDDNIIILQSNEAKNIVFEIANNEYNFVLIIDETNENAEWLSITLDSSTDTYTIKWNIKHAFFKQLADEPKFISIMQSFIFGLAISEVQSTKLGENGLINPSTIRKSMNLILRKIGEGNINERDN